MRVAYRPAAIQDIQRLCGYIGETLGNPRAADRLKAELLHSISSLKAYPEQGVPLASKYEWIDSTMRILIVQKQLVFYEVNGEDIEIIRVLDGRTDYLAKLFPDSR